MNRWFIVIFLALMLISWFCRCCKKMGFGKLPGRFAVCGSTCLTANGLFQ